MFSFANNEKALLSALDKSQAIIHFNMDGTIIWANQNFLKTVGYTLDEIKGRHHSMFVDPLEAKSDVYRQFWAALNTGQFQNAQFRRLGKGGREIFLQAIYNPLFNGSRKPYRVVKVATDITIQTQKTAEALNRTQAVIHFNLDGTIIEANENFCKSVGYSLSEITGQHHSMFVEPDYAASPAYKQFWAALNRGEFQAGKFQRVGRGGRTIWLQASYNPYYNTEGQLYKIVKYASDITREESLATETNAAVNQVARATTEMTSSINEISRSMSGTKESVHKVSEQTSLVTDSVEELVNSSKSMSAVVTLIEEISNQINLLALNAAIEAARAGDAGRGFSVVADEVKKLASQTGKSTSDISERILDIQRISGQVSNSLGQIQSLVQVVTQDTNSIAAATEEQSAVINDISDNMTKVSGLINSRAA